MTEVNPFRGRIFDIKRFAVHDGPGIRTTVFLKGCSLRCAWCHNPEAIRPQPELAFYAQLCIGCGACVEACPNGAHERTGEGARVFHRERCEACGKCVETCFAGALEVHGREVGVEELMTELRRDAPFYFNSGGGITLSGGEPLLQRPFVTHLLRRCKTEGFHTAVDTCGQVGWEAFEEVLPFVDLVLYDIKHMDPAHHRRHTGGANGRILENLRRLSLKGAQIEVRMPIVPTVNDDRESIEAAGRELRGLDNIAAVRLLAYHRLAGEKYLSVGRDNTMPDVGPPDPSRLEEIAGWLRGFGLKVITPGGFAEPLTAFTTEITENTEQT